MQRRLTNLIRGAGSLSLFPPPSDKVRTLGYRYSSVDEAIRQDWEVVGRQLRNAMIWHIDSLPSDERRRVENKIRANGS